MSLKFSLETKRRIVIKIGSSLLVDSKNGLRHTWLNSMADDIKLLRELKKEVVIVSSGAIALGRSIVNFGGDRLRLDESQAAAAVGQIELGRVYREVLEHRNLNCGQILVTFVDTEQRRRYLNARATIQCLLRLGVVPVVNENDTVVTDEIRFGDNDRLSARVAIMTSADLLVILSDVDGLHTGIPGRAESNFVPVVETITSEVEQMAGGAGSAVGKGGMVTKIKAAKIATRSGTEMVIASGLKMNPISSLLGGGKFTLFKAQGTPNSSRKKWIASDLANCGSLVVDAGAASAVRAGNSLLPIGVAGINGAFARGDVVELITVAGELIGRGISNYDYSEARQIIGFRTGQIKKILGYYGPENLIHRDDMVLF